MKARNRNKARKAIRQAEALERQKAYDALDRDAKVTRALTERPGRSHREIDRLLA